MGLISTDCSTRPGRVSRLAAKDCRSPCAIGRHPLAKRAGRIPARPPPARKLRRPNHRRPCLSIHSTRRRENRPLKDPQQRTAAHAETQIAMPCAFNAFCGVDVANTGGNVRGVFVASTPKSYDSFKRRGGRLLHNAVRAHHLARVRRGPISSAAAALWLIGHLSSFRSTNMSASLARQTVSPMRCPPSRLRVSSGGAAPRAAWAG